MNLRLFYILLRLFTGLAPAHKVIGEIKRLLPFNFDVELVKDTLFGVHMRKWQQQQQKECCYANLLSGHKILNWIIKSSYQTLYRENI